MSTPSRSRFVARKRQDRGERRIADVVGAASFLFGKHGFDGTTMNAIAARAGLSIGSLYQYFPDKDAIVDAVAAAYVRAWEAQSLDLSRLPLEKPLRFAEVVQYSIERTVQFNEKHAAIGAFLRADPRRAPSILDIQTKIDYGIPLLAHFYPRATRDDLAGVVEICALLVRTGTDAIADDHSAKRDWYVRELSTAVIAYISARLGAPLSAAPLTSTLTRDSQADDGRLAAKPQRRVSTKSTH